MNSQTRKISLGLSLSSKLLASFAVIALALCFLPQGRADACGSYGPPTEEDHVRQAVEMAFVQNTPVEERAGRWFAVHSVDIIQGRIAFAKARLHFGDRASEPSTTYVLYKVGGTWCVADTPTMLLSSYSSRL